MLKALKSLFSPSRELKPDEYTVYTVHEGKEYVSHDGLGLKQPKPEFEQESVVEPSDEHEPIHMAEISEEPDCEPMDSGGGLFSDDIIDSDSSMDDPGINPATGLPMINATIDIGGNIYGTSDDSTSIGIGMDDHGISAGSDIGIDSFSSFDDDLF